MGISKFCMLFVLSSPGMFISLPLVGHGHPFRIAIRKLMNRRGDFRKNETRVGNCCTIVERSLRFNFMKCVVMVVVILVMLDMLVENILYMHRVGWFMT